MPRSTTSFEGACQALFADHLGFGRRWKTAAAQALGIGRATLYRYFNEKHAAPADVWARLNALRSGSEPVREERAMVTLFARGLLELQKQIDSYGWAKEGYPRILQRAFDLAAARNALDGTSRWPTDLMPKQVCAGFPTNPVCDSVSPI